MTLRLGLSVVRSLDEPTPPPRDVSIDEAISLAVALHQSDQLEAAGAIYREVLNQVPDHAVALQFAGVLAHQEGRSDEAITLIERSLAGEPHRADWFSNFGNVLQSRGRFDEAVAAYQRAIELDPRHANAHCNLGVLLRAQGRLTEAEQAYRTAVEIQPEHIDAYTNLGILLNHLGRTPEAVACFCRVITLRPKHPDARRLLALAHCTVGEIDKAVAIYEEWLRDEPDDPIALHMLAACSGRDIPFRAADGFVEQVFDNFAASFESKLARLSYRAPALVAKMVEESEPPANKSLDILDAGCGTGLCGPLLAPFARRLVGVDLSAGMLAQASDKRVYDELVKGELTAYLGRCRGAYDLIVSADTLVYFGSLEKITAPLADALKPGGSAVFTLEAAAGDDDNGTFRLEHHGRYVHSRGYVERQLGAAGLACEVRPAELRMEAGAPVAGLVIRATKPSVRVDVDGADVAARSGEHDG